MLGKKIVNVNVVNATENKIALKKENDMKKCLLSAIKSDKVLMLCRAFKCIALYCSRNAYNDKGFIYLAIDV